MQLPTALPTAVVSVLSLASAKDAVVNYKPSDIASAANNAFSSAGGAYINPPFYAPTGSYSSSKTPSRTHVKSHHTASGSGFASSYMSGSMKTVTGTGATSTASNNAPYPTGNGTVPEGAASGSIPGGPASGTGGSGSSPTTQPSPSSPPASSTSSISKGAAPTLSAGSLGMGAMIGLVGLGAVVL